MFKWLSNRIITRTIQRPPDFIVGKVDAPYLLRWHLIKNKFINVYLHKFLRSDIDRALHDHVSWSISVLLDGTYDEITPNGRKRYTTGNVIVRNAEQLHRIELVDNQPVWTLWIRGPKQREWGFACPKGWVHWKDFVDEQDHGNVGKGCP